MQAPEGEGARLGTRRLAFVLSGGASGGAYQVGALRALAEAGIRPDLVMGTSAGALNAAAFAADPTSEGLGRLAGAWSAARRRDLFPIRPETVVAALRHRSDHFLPDTGLRQWISAHLDVANLEDTVLPVHVVATALHSGEPVVLSRGAALPALLASSAIPGLLPPVTIGGRQLVDGGIAADTPLHLAEELGATDIVVLPAFAPTGPGTAAMGPAALGWYAYEQVFAHWSLDQSVLDDDHRLYRVPLPPRDGHGPLDFSAGASRMADAYRLTYDWLGLDSLPRLRGRLPIEPEDALLGRQGLAAAPARSRPHAYWHHRRQSAGLAAPWRRSDTPADGPSRSSAASVSP